MKYIICTPKCGIKRRGSDKPRLHERFLKSAKQRVRKVLCLFAPIGATQQVIRVRGTSVIEDLTEISAAKAVIKRRSLEQGTTRLWQFSLHNTPDTVKQQDITDEEEEVWQENALPSSGKRLQWSPITSRIYYRRYAQIAEIVPAQPVKAQSLMEVMEATSWSSSPVEGLERCEASATAATAGNKTDRLYALRQSDIGGSSLASITQTYGEGQSSDDACLFTTFKPSIPRPHSPIKAPPHPTAFQPSSSSLLIGSLIPSVNDVHETCTAAADDEAVGHGSSCGRNLNSTLPTRASMLVVNGMTPEELIKSICFEFDQEGSPGYYGPQEYERDQERRRRKAAMEKQRQKQRAVSANTEPAEPRKSPLSPLTLLARSLSARILFGSGSEMHTIATVRDAESPTAIDPAAEGSSSWVFDGSGTIMGTVSSVAATVWTRATGMTANNTKLTPLFNAQEREDDCAQSTSVTEAKAGASTVAQGS